MDSDDQDFQLAVQGNFFDGLGSGMLLSKKQQALKSTVLKNSQQQLKTRQKTLDQRIDKYRKDDKVKRVSREKIITKKIETETKQQKVEVEQPSTSFQELNLIKPLLKIVKEMGYSRPTPIQSLTIPAILSGKDVLASSITGSGKTAAFLLPILQKFYHAPDVNYSRVLIVTPTRELAIQCYECFSMLNKYVGLDACLVIGASSLQKQESQLRNYPEIIIGTPGRLLDLLTNSQSFGLEGLQVLVFDEADKLLQLGFEGQIRQILSHFSGAQVQTLLFSATMGRNIDKLAGMSMHKPLRLSANPDNSTAQKLHQQVLKLNREDEEYREAALLTLLTRVPEYSKKVIIFFKTKKQCHRMAIVLGLLGLSACQLHGNLSQTQRITAFQDFKEGKYEYLLATDLAARGLDIKQVKSVVNFELPTELTRYIHRVGRTARAGAIGTCLTICSDKESLRLKKMTKETGDKLYKLALSEQHILENLKNIQSLASDFRRIMQEEREERELRLAQMQIKKIENVQQHQKEIMNRPRRQWFRTEKEKKKVREMSKRLSEGLPLEQPDEQPVRTKKIGKQKGRFGKSKK